MTQSIMPLEHNLSVGSLSAYINWANRIPLLSAEEESQLATELQQTGSVEAARKLVMSHLRLVIKIARGYNGYGLQQADLIQEGSIGLMKAVKRFDPTVGVRLVSFAIHWIRAEMHEFILKNWRIVKVATTKAQRKLFFNLRKAAKSRGWFSQQEIAVVAETLGVSKNDVAIMEQRLNAHDSTFDSPALIHDDDSTISPASPDQYLEDHRADPAKQLEHHDWSQSQETSLHHALKNLDQRSQDILARRWLHEEKATLHELAEQYHVSAERIRQIEQNALRKLKNNLVFDA